MKSDSEILTESIFLIIKGHETLKFPMILRDCFCDEINKVGRKMDRYAINKRRSRIIFGG
jgi:hypothetical protein